MHEWNFTFILLNECTNKTDSRLTASFHDNLGKPAPERLNQSGF